MTQYEFSKLMEKLEEIRCGLIDVESAIHCPKCKSENVDGVIQCRHCGNEKIIIQ